MVGGANIVVQAALSQLGKPYVWDTPLSATDPDPKSFDCSGLAMWCYRKAGVKLQHQTNLQYHALQHRPLSEAQPGDLVFFGTLADLYHVGIYIGDSTIVEAPDYGIPVRRRKISPASTGIYKNVGVFPGASSTAGGAQPVTYRQFFTSVLSSMGLPVTDANLRALARVSIIEGTNDRWNPLNSVVQSGSSQSFNSVGVQDYGSYSNGVAGTVKLLQGSPWRNVVDALRLGNSEGGVISAFANTYASWGSHPAFGSISDSRADTLLNTSMGNAVTGASSGFQYPPPYNVPDLHKPLTAAQRSALLIWMQKVNATYGANSKSSDDKLIESYKIALAQFHFNPNDVSQQNTIGGDPITNGLFDWASGLGKALSWLTSVKNWERIGLFTLGAVILLLTVVELFRSNTL